MGRPREFNEDDAIAGALQAFWKQGYGATSIPDLIAATDLQRGSLYQAFGDKHALFVRAFDTYLDQARTAMAQVLDAPGPPLERFRNWLQRLNRGCSGASRGPGCLAVNAMVELAPTDAAIRVRLNNHWSLIERMLEHTLREGQDQGSIRQDVGARELARLVVRMLTGVAVFSRQGTRSDVGATLLTLISAGPRSQCDD